MIDLKKEICKPVLKFDFTEFTVNSDCDKNRHF